MLRANVRKHSSMLMFCLQLTSKNGMSKFSAIWKREITSINHWVNVHSNGLRATPMSFDYNLSCGFIDEGVCISPLKLPFLPFPYQPLFVLSNIRTYFRRVFSLRLVMHSVMISVDCLLDKNYWHSYFLYISKPIWKIIERFKTSHIIHQ